MYQITNKYFKLGYEVSPSNVHALKQAA